jgi:hypothetical protein
MAPDTGNGVTEAPALPKPPKKPVLLRARRCKYCRATFVPSDPRALYAKFCCEQHRKMFWRYGGLPFDKMKVQIEKHMRKIVREEMIAPISNGESEAVIRRIVREEITAFFKQRLNLG